MDETKIIRDYKYVKYLDFSNHLEQDFKQRPVIYIVTGFEAYFEVGQFSIRSIKCNRICLLADGKIRIYGGSGFQDIFPQWVLHAADVTKEVAKP